MVIYRWGYIDTCYFLVITGKECYCSKEYCWFYCYNVYSQFVQGYNDECSPSDPQDMPLHCHMLESNVAYVSAACTSPAKSKHYWNAGQCVLLPHISLELISGYFFISVSIFNSLSNNFMSSIHCVNYTLTI